MNIPCFKPLLRTPGLTYYIDPDTGEYKRDARVSRLNLKGELDGVVRKDLKSPVISVLGEVGYRQLVPCGKCLGCRLDQARQWADRLTLELLDHDPLTCFALTLTYEIPPITPDGRLTLSKRDTQLFWKRLRKELYPVSPRYFLSGEYGSRTFRPHYHAIVFGLPLSDLEFSRKTQDGHLLFNSRFLDRVWQHGRVDVFQVNYQTCAYVASYCLKKLSDQAGFLNLGIEPEFTLMSRRPGIGLNGFDPSIYDTDRIYLPNGRTERPPRYFDKQMESVDLNRLRDCKDRRVIAAELAEASRAVFDSRSYSRFLSDREADLRQRRVRQRDFNS